MYQSDTLDDQPINTNSIAIPPLPSSCSLIISDEENVDSEFSSSIPSRKAQMYRPIRPAPETNYVLPEVNNSMDSLPPIPIVTPCDSDPCLLLPPTSFSDFQMPAQEEPANAYPEVVENGPTSNFMPPRRRFNYDLEEKKFMQKYYALYCQQKIPPKTIARRIFNLARNHFPYFSHSEKQVRIFVYNSKQAIARKNKKSDV